MFCPNCGNQMSDGAMFCANCGWSENGSQKNLTGIKNKLANKPIFLLVGAVLILFILFKIITSFGDVASFAREIKTVEKQLKDGDFVSVVRNNIDYSDTYYTPEEIIQGLNSSQSSNGMLSASLMSSLLKGSKLEKKLEKVSKETEKAVGLKYKVKKIEKGKVRLTLSFNLPRPTVLNNSKIADKISKVAMDIVSIASQNIFSNNVMGIANQLVEFDKPVIDILKTYKSLGKDVKQNFDIYVDFYKVDGHWKYKLSESYNDGVRIGREFESWANEWSNSSNIWQSFISRYGLNF